MSADVKLLSGLRSLGAQIVSASPRKAAASMTLMLVLGLTEGMGLLLLLPLLGLVGIDQPATLPVAVRWFETMFRAAGVTPTLGSVLVLFIVTAGLRGVLMRAQTWLNAAVQEDVTVAVRVRLYRAIAGAEWQFLATRRSSEFAHLLSGEAARMGGAAFQAIDCAVVTVVSLVYLSLAVHLSPGMAPLVFACAAALAWRAQRGLDHARTFGARAASARGELHVAITEHMGSMKTTKSYGAAGRHIDEFVRRSHELREVTLEVTRGEGDLQQSIEFGSTVMLAIIVLVSYRILEASTAQILVVLFLFSRLMPRIVTIYRRLQAIMASLPVLESLTAFEGELLAAAEPIDADLAPPVLSRAIRLEQVSFTYLRRSEPALKDLTLQLDAGLTTAVVGSSGAGKSTLADLLMGLLVPTSGRVLIDGVPLTRERFAGWRQQIGYVAQDTFLFHNTVRANLVWARPDATDDDLWQALRLAAADTFVRSLPQGLDTTIGERGILVSGGERQRLSLTRALLRRPRVLVLDEATSSLDSETEGRIQQAIDSLHREMTIIVVTHRLSMISGADMIHVLHEGRLVESGTWEELLARPNGRFVELCRAQGIFRRPAPVMSAT